MTRLYVLAVPACGLALLGTLLRLCWLPDLGLLSLSTWLVDQSARFHPNGGELS